MSWTVICDLDEVPEDSVLQCKIEDIEGLLSIYDKLKVEADVGFFFNDVGEKLKNCHLFIGRAGASTIAELLSVGRPSILIPYSFAVDNHQAKNADFVGDIGAGWIIPEKELNPYTLARHIGIFFDSPHVLKNAAFCAKKSGYPHASEDLANIVCDLQKRRACPQEKQGTMA